MEGRPRAIVFEALDRPDLAIAALRAVRKEQTFDNVGALIAVTSGRWRASTRRAASTISCCIPTSRRALRPHPRRSSGGAASSPPKSATRSARSSSIKAAHEVMRNGRPVALTAKEFALLAFLCERRGKALSREQLLAQGVGQPLRGRAAHGRHPRPPPARQARRRAPPRNSARLGLQAESPAEPEAEVARKKR